MEISVINDGNFSILDRRTGESDLNLGLNCYLLKSKTENILIDTGIGNSGYFDHARYSPDLPRKLLVEMADKGLNAEDIGHVILTHLHFDHFFGCFDKLGTIVFPKAVFYVQEKEIEYYNSESDDMISRLLCILKNEDRIIFLNGDKELPGGVKVHFSGSHTPGFQYVSATDHFGNEHIFPGDIIPTIWHINNSNPEGIDHDPEKLASDKRNILESCLKNSSVLHFQHSKSILSSRITCEKGRIRLLRSKK